MKHRNDREPAAELEDRGVELAAASGRAELSHALDGGGEQRRHAFGIHAVGNARIDGQPIAAHH